MKLKSAKQWSAEQNPEDQKILKGTSVCLSWCKLLKCSILLWIPQDFVQAMKPYHIIMQQSTPGFHWESYVALNARFSNSLHRAATT